MCDQFAVKFAVMLPPVLDRHQKTNAVIAACRRAGVPILIPYASGELNETFYRDGFHLNAAGEQLFTARFCDQVLASGW